MDTRDNKAAAGTPVTEWIDALVRAAHKIADAEGI
jgi:hypothetical protein